MRSELFERLVLCCLRPYSDYFGLHFPPPCGEPRTIHNDAAVLPGCLTYVHHLQEQVRMASSAYLKMNIFFEAEVEHFDFGRGYGRPANQVSNLTS